MTVTKNNRIYVRVNDAIKEDFEMVAAYRGLKTSALLHSLIVKTIHEQRESTPQIFKENIAFENLSGEFEKVQNNPQSEKFSKNKGADKKTKKSVKTISIGSDEIPLIDEAESAIADEQEEQ